MIDTTLPRCNWALSSRIEMQYHDEVWGNPVHDSHQLFKMLMLEGQQAGLSWVTILRKWNALCTAYDDFDPERLAQYDDAKRAELVANPGIIRNRLKIAAATTNACAFLTMRDQGLAFDTYCWEFVDGTPIVNHWKDPTQVPSFTPIAQKMSEDLKRRGFSFVGPTIVYAFMQSTGMVNDHIRSCAFRGTAESI
ncbi:DNA-3-methyladenine glycosylase I [Stomatohabitans albus]|uniref:DNA-3-methyladenine glycosylase I n=1 Tax=Stomatohabitans albus TaxID=3110766 RepID=UPI00300D99B6